MLQANSPRGPAKWLALAALTLTSQGCILASSSTDLDATSTADTQTSGGVTAVGAVFDPSGAPMAGVTARAGSQSATSDGNGQFNLPLGKVNKAVVLLEKAGYAPAYRLVEPKGGTLVTVSAVLSPVTTTGMVTPQDGGTVAVTGGASITFPAGALVTTAGEAPMAPAQITVTWLPPTQAAAQTPFLLQAYDGTVLTPLVSYGMLEVTATALGQPLQLKSGTSAQWRAPALGSDPDSIGLFYGNPASGLWELQGAAGKVGSEYVVQLPHLSWWNLDGFYKVPTDQQACVTFRAKGPTGVPIPGVEIRSKWGNNYTIAGGTDVSGLLCHEHFPGGTTLEIQWKAAMAAGATALVSGSLSVTPSAYGAKCGAADCQIVDIPIQCTTNSHCGPGGKCTAGVCTGTSSGSDASGADTLGDTQGDVPGDKPCVPVCKPNQCSDDGCGKPCAACPSGQSCNGATQQCETCTPDCSGQTCGSNGCTGNCGLCAAGSSCNGQKCVGPCTFCASGACNLLGFEDGLPGWDTSGDVAVVDKMGPAVAPEGKKMLRLSTGLAYAAPSWAQKALCASKGVTKVTFQWRMFSEEFDEYCGSTYQDYFVVWALGAGGAKTELARWTIDQLCPNGQHNCTTCGSKSVGISKTDVTFDKGDVWATPWQSATLPLPAGGESATLVWEVADVGDSAFDTVVLVDGISFTP